MRDATLASAVFQSGHGAYRLIAVAPPQHDGDALILTLALERSDGIERIGIRCRIDHQLVMESDMDQVFARLASWIERDFEHTREAALKSIRAERRLLELSFDGENRGPF
jgi:hypothetical protein